MESALKTVNECLGKQFWFHQEDKCIIEIPLKSYTMPMITFYFSDNNNIFNLGATGDMALLGEC